MRETFGLVTHALVSALDAEASGFTGTARALRIMARDELDDLLRDELDSAVGAFLADATPLPAAVTLQINRDLEATFLHHQMLCARIAGTWPEADLAAQHLVERLLQHWHQPPGHDSRPDPGAAPFPLPEPTGTTSPRATTSIAAPTETLTDTFTGPLAGARPGGHADMPDDSAHSRQPVFRARTLAPQAGKSEGTPGAPPFALAPPPITARHIGRSLPLRAPMHL